MKTHYKSNATKQKRYEEVCEKMTATLKDRYGEGFDEAVHPDMVRQYARSIIRGEEAEERIDNGEADKSDYSTLKAERSLQKDIIDRLKLSIRGIVGDTRSFSKDKPTDMIDFMMKKIKPFIKDGDDDETD